MMNLGAGFALIFIVIHYFVKDRELAKSMAVKAKEDAVRSKNELEHAYQQLQSNEIKIRELMMTDSLTGLANRRALGDRFEDEMARFLRYGTKLSLIMTDIDYFKKINDTYGHAKGDEILVKLSKLLKADLRPTDFVARYGGEEFIIILPETSEESAMITAERIRSILETTSIIGIDSPVTASFGVTQIHDQDSSKLAFMRVDDALYKSKKNGRNQVTLLSRNN